jgi:hypothetical protein
MNVRCSKCGCEFAASNNSCPKCKSGDRTISVSEKLNLTEHINLSGRSVPPRKGKHKDDFNLSSGYESSGDATAFPQGVDRYKLEDRRNDLYREKVINLDTGEITRDLTEPLSEHRKPKQRRQSQ